MGLGHGVKVERASSEKQLFKLLQLLFWRLDPDIVTGYEIQNSALGYLLDRARHLNVSACMHPVLSLMEAPVTYDARAVQDPRWQT